MAEGGRRRLEVAAAQRLLPSSREGGGGGSSDPSGSGDPESEKSGFGVFAELLENAKYCTTYAVYSMPLPHNGFIMAPVIEFRAPKCVVKTYKRQRYIRRENIDKIQKANILLKMTTIAEYTFSYFVDPFHGSRASTCYNIIKQQQN